MEHIKRVLSYTRRAVDDYNMIEEGDRVAVGISGGKDSMTLLCALADLRRFYPKKFDIVAIRAVIILLLLSFAIRSGLNTALFPPRSLR